MGAQAALVLPRKSDSVQPSSKPLVAMAKAMKAMKVMKKKAAMKAMKSMKKKSLSKIGRGRYAKSMVLRGKKEKTVGGLTAKDLIKNKYGKVVSKKSSARAKTSPWIAAVTNARSALKVKGFVAVKKGSPLYAKAKSLYKPKADIELLAAEAAPKEEDEEDEQDQDDDEQQEQDEQDDESEDDVELLAATAAPEEESEEEQEQEEQDDDEEQEQDDDESEEDIELLAAKSK